jgi:hypothetical protein
VGKPSPRRPGKPARALAAIPDYLIGEFNGGLHRHQWLSGQSLSAAIRSGASSRHQPGRAFSAGGRMPLLDMRPDLTVKKFGR